MDKLQTKNPHIEMVTTHSHLIKVVSSGSRHTRVAVDIESNGLHRYNERVCLVQLEFGGTAFLIDTLAIKDVSPLGRLLADTSVQKIFHASDYDVRSLDRDWGFRISNLFDTSIASAFLGSTHLSLAAVLQEHLGVGIEKQTRVQRSDWTNRPIGAEAQEYAANDVIHLTHACRVLTKKLNRLSRLDWVAEECERMEAVKHRPTDREWSFLTMKGSRDLDGRSLAILRSLHDLRESEARRIDRPPFKVAQGTALVQLAARPDSKLSDVKGLGRFARPPGDRRLRAAINEGRKSNPVKRPQKPKPPDSDLIPHDQSKVRTRLNRLKEWRGQIARDLHIEAGLLWPLASLRRLAMNPGCLEHGIGSSDVRRWQQREFTHDLKSVLSELSQG